MPSSDQGDRRAARPRRKAKRLPSPSAAANRKAFAEIRRNVAKQQAAKTAVRPNPDQQAGVSKGPSVKRTRVAIRTRAQEENRKQAIAHRTDRTEARSRPVAPALAKLPIKTILVTDLKHPNAKPVVHVYRYDKTRKQPMITTGEARRMAGIDLGKRIAPGVKLLNETLRPVHGVAGTADALVRGKGVGGALGEGAKAVRKNKGPMFSDVLKHAGAPKIVRAPLGFALDVGLDPTTYLTGGTAAVGRKALAKDLARIAAKADKAGMSDAGKAAVLRAAKKKAAATERRGVAAKFGGHEVPGVTRASATVGRGARKAGGKAPAPLKAVLSSTRDVVREVHPQLKPVGADRAEFTAARDAGRIARASDAQAMARLQREGNALGRKIGKDNYADVIHAIETGKIGSLPAELREPAQFLRSTFRHAERQRRQAGVPQGHITDYFPHARVKEIEEGTPILDAPRSTGTGVRSVNSRKARTGHKTVRENNADPKRTVDFSTDIPSVHVNYGADTAHIVNQTKFLRDLASAGRALKTVPDKADVVLRFATKDGRLAVEQASRKDVENELERRVLRQQQRTRKLRPEELHFLKQGGAGQYVVMNAQTAKETLGSYARSTERSEAGRVFDQASGTWKRVATATPGFHVRNYIGAAQQMYLSVPGHKMAGAYVEGRRAVKALSKDERQPLAGVSAAAKKTVKVRGKQVPMEGFIEEAKRQGVVRSGFYGRELEDMTRGKLRTLQGDRTAGAKRFVQNIEDVFRLSTYKNGLDQGLDSAAAARRALETHIDYGDVSSLERKILRRALPFYTFSARSIPFHAKRLVTNPGKFATYAKAREETARAAGYSDAEEADKDLPEYQQRQAPLFLKLGGKTRTLGVGLPITAINELPAGLSLGKYAAELRDYTIGMSNPLLQMPIEMAANRSFFTRRDIESQYAPDVPAPSWVKDLPPGVRKRMHITLDYIDKRTGKRVPAWPGKTDYLFKKLPGAFYLANQLATAGGGRDGQGSADRIAQLLTGIKAAPISPVDNAINLLREHKTELQKKQSRLSLQGKNFTPEYKNRTKEIGFVDDKLTELTKIRGDAIPNGKRRKDVVRAPAEDSGGWQIGGGSSSGGGDTGGWQIGG